MNTLNDTMYLCSALAVASGSAVFLFKSLRPYYKFVLPNMEIAQVEKDVWLKAREVCRCKIGNNDRLDDILS